MILTHPEPRLRQRALPIDFQFPAEFAKDLLYTAESYNALGLASPQVGIPLRMFAMRNKEDRLVIVVNPRIVMGDGIISALESCLSCPDLGQVSVNRFKKVVVEYETPCFQLKQVLLRGLPAVIFQHELDHLNGVLLIDKANLGGKG